MIQIKSESIFANSFSACYPLGFLSYLFHAKKQFQSAQFFKRNFLKINFIISPLFSFVISTYEVTLGRHCLVDRHKLHACVVRNQVSHVNVYCVRSNSLASANKLIHSNKNMQYACHYVCEVACVCLVSQECQPFIFLLILSPNCFAFVSKIYTQCSVLSAHPNT